MLTPQPGWAEQDMDAVWEAAADAIRAALERASPGEIVGVSVAGQGDGAWMIDDAGRPVAPAPLWNDGRATEALARWDANGALHELYMRGGTILWTGAQAALLAWFAENRPELLARASTVFCAKDWIRYCLTGSVGTDTTDGSIPFMDLAERRISSDQAAILGLEEHIGLVPDVTSSSDIVGAVTDAAADRTGLVPGTPVVAGVLDVAANAVGVGAVDGGQAMVILGTTALAAVLLDEARFEPADIGASVCHAPDGRWMRALGSMAGTPNVDWYLEAMGGGITTEAAASGRDVFAVLEDAISTSPIGAGGVIYHPYLRGERVPFNAPQARGSFFGLGMETSQADLARAVSEGVAFAVRDMFEAVGAPVSEVRLCGGGSNSQTWSQILADVTGAQMIVASGSQFGALGAAIAAGVGVGIYPDYASAVERCVRVDRVHEPNRSAQTHYDERYALYHDLIEVMQPHWSRLAGDPR